MVTRLRALIAIKIAPPLIVLIAASPTYPPMATAVSALPPGRAMNEGFSPASPGVSVVPLACSAACPGFLALGVQA